MAINLDAIRKRMQQLGGTPRFWKPEIGEYRIRVIPWNPNDPIPEGDVFPTLFFYNLGEGPSWQQICAPKQFGKPDPIDDLLTELWKGDESDKEIAKKLKASGQTYIAFVDRNALQKGVQVWKLPGGKTGVNLHQKLLGYFVDAEVLEETDDWTDIKKGFDLKITVTDSGKKFNNKPVLDFAVEIARKPSKLTDDADQLKKWLDARPSTKDYYTLESAESIKKKVETWLTSGSKPTAPSATDTSDGTTRGKQVDPLDQMANDVSSKSKPAQKQSEDADPPPNPNRKALDDALKELEGD